MYGGVTEAHNGGNHMEFITWLLLAGAAVGAAGLWYSWKRRQKSKTEK
jgi:LPXTG-motif cell wall-anchored protein